MTACVMTPMVMGAGGHHGTDDSVMPVDVRWAIFFYFNSAFIYGTELTYLYSVINAILTTVFLECAVHTG